MLIASDRHTPADLELWSEYDSADRVHKVSEAKLLKSVDAIRSFRADYAGVSWGKDSVVLAHLIWLHSPQTPLVHIRQIPTGNPECLRVRDAFLSLFDVQYVEYTADYRGCGKSAMELEGKTDKIFYGNFQSAGSRYHSGIRANESGGRAIRCRRYGLLTKNTSAPLAWWTSEDVFSYLAAHDLPIHPSYAMLGGGRWDRQQIRVDEVGGFRGNQFGRSEWEQEYYGDVLRRVAIAAFKSQP